ncbi:MAG: bifunctional demethylmenaquinone methyltransferase/2-methoxy-6-polyprenyl-1,4-benzoquinol methylase UbiE [Alphaproteobacteria bacterium]|nr:bifunctional demethylmenaquinone methyltransferase/2-methoxy-6-polyprenyl-1,4-benzoquinol methylase UbiE [Alphaproteobacteria bacterium]
MAALKRKPQENPESEWFGYRRIDASEKTGLVEQVFASVAGNYDLMNDLMSGGLHRLWKDTLVRRMRPRAGQTLLDVAGGTGDIALRCHKKTEGKAKIIVCDINPAMLERGKAKALDQGVMKGLTWVTGNAEELPFPDRSVDTYSIAFGLRNVTRIDKALREAARVLRPGGRFFCMEFSPGVMPAIRPFYEAYCMNVLPLLGEFVAKDRNAYKYLAESIMKFPEQAELAARMEKAGLSRAKWTDLTGGIAVIHEGWRI